MLIFGGSWNLPPRRVPKRRVNALALIFPKLKKNQFYFEDLVHMEVLIQKKVVGSVKNVCCHGAGEYLEIECKKRELLVPFNFDHILEISLEKKQIFLNRDYYEV